MGGGECLVLYSLAKIHPGSRSKVLKYLNPGQLSWEVLWRCTDFQSPSKEQDSTWYDRGLGELHLCVTIAMGCWADLPESVDKHWYDYNEAVWWLLPPDEAQSEWCMDMSHEPSSQAKFRERDSAAIQGEGKYQQTLHGLNCPCNVRRVSAASTAHIATRMDTRSVYSEEECTAVSRSGGHHWRQAVMVRNFSDVS